MNHRQRDPNQVYPVLRKITIDAIVGPLLVVEEYPGVKESIHVEKAVAESKVVVVRNRSEGWSKMFFQYGRQHARKHPSSKCEEHLDQ